MVIYSYFYGWKGDRILEILNMQTKDEELQREAVKYLHEDEAVEFAKNTARTTMEQAMKEIDSLLPD
jgi:hypothetical protein